jgi:hypothetical protein
MGTALAESVMAAKRIDLINIVEVFEVLGGLACRRAATV